MIKKIIEQVHRINKNIDPEVIAVISGCALAVAFDGVAQPQDKGNGQPTADNTQRDAILLLVESVQSLPLCPKWQFKPKGCQCIKCRVERFVEQNSTRL